MMWNDWVVLILNPISVVAFIFIIALRREGSKSNVYWQLLLRTGFALMACGLVIQMGMSWIRIQNHDPMFHPSLWVLKDLGIFLSIMARVGETFQYNYFTSPHPSKYIRQDGQP